MLNDLTVLTQRFNSCKMVADAQPKHTHRGIKNNHKVLSTHKGFWEHGVVKQASREAKRHHFTSASTEH